jgi:phosphate-selective porin OprO/OprP
VGVAGLTSRSRYTSFSSEGGDQLDGFAPGVPGQYSLTQVAADFLLKYRGVSVQHESHWKSVHDNVNALRTNLQGAYAQAGCFPQYAAGWIPKPLEVGYRYAVVDPNTAKPGDVRGEHAFVINWFFEGHENKLTFEVGRVTLNRPDRASLREFRYRLQWDVQF